MRARAATFPLWRVPGRPAGASTSGAARRRAETEGEIQSHEENPAFHRALETERYSEAEVEATASANLDGAA
jgi:hypothetical protein